MQQRHILNVFIILLFLLAGGVILWQSFQPRSQTNAIFTTPMDTVSQAENNQSTPTSVADAIPVEMIEKDDSVSQVADTQKATQTISLDANNYAFSQKKIQVKVGQKVVLTLNNVEGLHDLRIDELNVATRQLKAQESETVEFTPLEAGTYEYYCSVGNHRAMGMVGIIIVE